MLCAPSRSRPGPVVATSRCVRRYGRQIAEGMACTGTRLQGVRRRSVIAETEGGTTLDAIPRSVLTARPIGCAADARWRGQHKDAAARNVDHARRDDWVLPRARRTNRACSVTSALGFDVSWPRRDPATSSVRRRGYHHLHQSGTTVDPRFTGAFGSMPH